MSRRKKVNKFKVAIVVFALLVFFMSVTGLGRFTYNAVRDRYLSSKKFYFTSDLLTPNGNASEPHVYENWDGIGIYELDINMFSKNNDLERYEGDLDYSVKLDYNKNKILCSLYYNDFSRSTGNEYYTNEAGDVDRRQKIPVNNEGKLKIYIKLNEDYDEELGEEFDLKVTAYTSEPYKKTIEGTFKLIMSDLAFYMQDDQDGVPHVLMNIRNNKDYDSYVTIKIKQLGDVKFDLNSNVYLNAITDTGTGSDKTGIVKSGNYVKELTFLMPKESSENIRFYKTDSDNEIVATDYNQWMDVFSIEREKKQ